MSAKVEAKNAESAKTDSNKDVRKLIQMIKKIDFCMLTTLTEDGSMHSRPMSINGEIEENGNMWFFTYGDSHKVLEAQKNSQVGVTFSDIAKNNYVAVSGTASLVRDKKKIAELWKPELIAWFPQGVETADIALLYVKANRGEFWDAPAPIVAQTVAVFNTLTGTQTAIGDNKKVDL